jgi:hypothetical protein
MKASEGKCLLRVRQVGAVFDQAKSRHDDTQCATLIKQVELTLDLYIVRPKLQGCVDFDSERYNNIGKSILDIFSNTNNDCIFQRSFHGLNFI